MSALLGFVMKSQRPVNCLHIDGAGSNKTRQGCRLEKYHVTSGATGILMSRRGLI